ncbi:MAG: hypothetical protein RI907_2824 [Pseudomonadota bacterium]|jgi:hypothetical protein
MRLSLVAIACCAAAFTLTGCGGGEKDVWGGVAPVVIPASTPVATLPAAGTWEIVSTTDDVMPGALPQWFDPTAYSAEPMDLVIDKDAQGNDLTQPYLMLMPRVAELEEKTITATTVNPLTGDSSTSEVTVKTPIDGTGWSTVSLFIDTKNVNKYVVAVQPKEKNYACAGPGYSAAELAQLAVSFGFNLARCEGTLTIDLSARTYKSTGLTLTQVQAAEGAAIGKTTIKVNAGWPIGFDLTTGAELTESSGG